jgi:replicative DNA helicase
MQYALDQGLKEDLFLSDEIREIVSFAIQYFLDSKLKYAVPEKVLQAEFEEYFKFNEEPYEDIIVSLVLDKIKQNYRSVQIKEKLRDAADSLTDDPESTLSELIDNLSLIRMQASTADRLEVYGEKIDARIDAYYDRAIAQEHGNITAFPFGWKELTEETWGIRPPELCIVAGFAGMGKSWCVEKMALAAAEEGVQTYLASLENTKEMTLNRLDCIVSGVPYREWERGQLTQGQLNRIKEARDKINSMTNLIIDTPDNIEEMTLMDLYHRALYFDAKLFVGDQLSWVHNPKRFREENPYLKLGDTVRNIAATTRAMNMASVWAHQLNRESQKGKGKKVQLQHMAGSSEVERYADWVFGLTATEDMKMQEKRVLQVIKARRGRDGLNYLMRWQLTDETAIEIERIGYTWS